jgi:hypothetical protein
MSPERPEDETLEELAGRLRRLPPPPVPPVLEARLLAVIPSAPRAPVRPTRFPLAALLAAAAAVALFAMRFPPAPPRPVEFVLPAADGPLTFWRCEQALRQSDVDESVVLNQVVPPFEWPIAGPVILADDRHGAPQ